VNFVLPRCAGVPVAAGLPAGQRFAADDAFLSPDGKNHRLQRGGPRVIRPINIAPESRGGSTGRYNVAGAGRRSSTAPLRCLPASHGDVIVADLFTAGARDPRREAHRPPMGSGTGVCSAIIRLRSYIIRRTERATRLSYRVVDHRDPRLAVVRVTRPGMSVFDLHVPTDLPVEHTSTERATFWSSTTAISRRRIFRSARHGTCLWR